ncbi:MAG: hypothetical protein RQ753_02105 [Desulfurivibrionaceae bacterium]|nr:hypothetical protein [Desulfobulbales bacterium]MDT8334470.1 hypothetical protein [Desulfurivibrionaceae bacterium]
MNIVKGLYFPGVAPSPASLGGLLCLLDEIEDYRIVEGEEESGGAASLYRRGRVVLPLGDERDRFLAMIRDIKAHAADYYGGFLATLSADALVDHDESSVRQLIAGLHGERKGGGRDSRVTEKIWQARLVLRLAEMLAREQLELDRELATLNRAERALFKALKGGGDERDDGDGDAGVIDPGNSISGLTLEGPGVERLLKAWSVIHAMDPLRPALLITDREEAAIALFDVLAEASGAGPRLLAEIGLPAVALDAIPACRAELGDARSAVLAAINEILGGDPLGGGAAFEKATQLWQERISAKGGAKNLLELYLLEGSQADKVWGRLSGMPIAATTGHRRQIVAVLKS